MPRPTTLPEPWRTLAACLGSVQALADALGTTPRTINGWASGNRRPTGTARLTIRMLFYSHRIEVPRFADTRKSGTHEPN